MGLVDWTYKAQESDFQVPVGTGSDQFVVTPAPSKKAENFANASMVNQIDERIFMTLTDVSIDFSASGKTLQSRRYREFIYHNFGKVTLALTGQCRSQEDLGKLAEFTVASHQLAISEYASVTSPLVRLHVYAGGEDRRRGQKGSHKEIVVEGHIEGFKRRHERWVNAPSYLFNFVVENWISGIGKSLTDHVDHGKTLKTYAGLFNDLGFTDAGSAFAGNPDDPFSKTNAPPSHTDVTSTGGYNLPTSTTGAGNKAVHAHKNHKKKKAKQDPFPNGVTSLPSLIP